MKKLLPYANFLAVGAGVSAALLRQWTLSAGADEKGLYPAFHPGWISYLAVMSAALICFFLMTRECGKNGLWHANFSDSSPALLGQSAAAAGFLVYGICHMELCLTANAAAAFLAIACAAALVVATVLQHQKKDGFAILYLLPCLFFALQLFLLGKQFSNETQLLRFAPQFFACAASSLASYELMGFGVGLGNRKRSLVCSLSAAALCFAAVSAASWVYIAFGLWHLLCHCSLAEPPEEAPEPAEEAAKEEAPEE